MGRTYAGILGPLALTTVVARGLVHGGNASSTLLIATGSLFAFAAVGVVIGRIAESVVWESVKLRFDREMKEREEASSAEAAG